MINRVNKINHIQWQFTQQYSHGLLLTPHEPLPPTLLLPVTLLLPLTSTTYYYHLLLQLTPTTYFYSFLLQLYLTLQLNLTAYYDLLLRFILTIYSYNPSRFSRKTCEFGVFQNFFTDKKIHNPWKTRVQRKLVRNSSQPGLRTNSPYSKTRRTNLSKSDSNLSKKKMRTNEWKSGSKYSSVRPPMMMKNRLYESGE